MIDTLSSSFVQYFLAAGVDPNTAVRSSIDLKIVKSNYAGWPELAFSRVVH
ncbi:MAG TPA: hypothetical protein VKX49_21555 [Bryobacteraceae bacterium]|nr:hypothetical protein [Bryobacteraceae bacterium]